jgi:diadenylate cyclase
MERLRHPRPGGEGVNLDTVLHLIGPRDLLDIFFVAVLIYYLLLLIRGTRAVQVLIGILIVGLLYYFARLTELATLQWLLGNLLIFLPFSVIVLFRQEIRRALAGFGRNPLWGLTATQKVENTFDEFVVAANSLAARRTGALIVIERLDGLRTYVENGISLDAELSYDLLINIFSPGTPLHDGAVIVQNDRIAAAACFLPLTLNPELSREFGSRHRAALGITQETDAVAVVVSEESGTISVAFDGRLTRNFNSKTLRNELYQRLITDLYPQPQQGFFRRLRSGPEGRQVSGGTEPLSAAEASSEERKPRRTA